MLEGGPILIAKKNVPDWFHRIRDNISVIMDESLYTPFSKLFKEPSLCETLLDAIIHHNEYLEIIKFLIENVEEISKFDTITTVYFKDKT